MNPCQYLTCTGCNVGKLVLPRRNLMNENVLLCNNPNCTAVVEDPYARHPR